jgi:TonB family protein
VSVLSKIQQLNRGLVFFLTLGVLAVALTPSLVLAEDGGERKVKNKVSPSYPEIAKKMGIAGIVRLQLTVAPNGSVKETKVIGGHPILVTAAVDAVKKWKYETSSAESTGTVEIKFDPGN